MQNYPSTPPSSFSIAHYLYESKKLEEAITICHSILQTDPNDFDTLCLLSLALSEQGDLNQALTTCEKAIHINPNTAPIFSHQAQILQRLNLYEEALQSYSQALNIDPYFSSARCNRGLLMHSLQRYHEALEDFEQILQYETNSAIAWANKGNTLFALNHFKDALHSYNQALALQPNYYKALANKGYILNKLGKKQEALQTFKKAWEIHPNLAESNFHLACALRNTHQHIQALDFYEHARALGFDESTLQYHESLCLLALENFTLAWEKFEKRWDVPELKLTHNSLNLPRWNINIPLKGKTILIESEQGYGDIIQFARYLTPLKELGAHIIFAVPNILSTLMSKLPYIDKILLAGDAVPHIDYTCPLLSLPFTLQTTNHIPNTVPYIINNPHLIKQWGEKLKPRQKIRVGIVWSASHRGVDRSIPLALWSILQILSIEWHTLQKEISKDDYSLLEKYSHIHIWAEELTDFAQTAALIHHMDLIISVDTAVAHLSGALGKPTWILIPYDNDWRWGDSKQESLWYPTARLFRQKDDWENVINEVNINLKEYCNLS
jgi:tetratricopeptide (TPR) repeat protein